MISPSRFRPGPGDKLEVHAAAVFGVFYPFQKTSFHQGFDSAANGDLVHRGALADFAGCQARVAAEHSHDPPFYDADLMLIPVAAGDSGADGVGQQGQAVGKKFIQLKFK